MTKEDYKNLGKLLKGKWHTRETHRNYYSHMFTTEVRILRESHKDNHILLYSDMFQELGFNMFFARSDPSKRSLISFRGCEKYRQSIEEYKHISSLIRYHFGLSHTLHLRA